MIKLDTPRTETEWRRLATSLVKANLQLARIDYVQLSRALAEIGVDEPPKNISSKLVRGSFSAALFLQILHVVGVERLDLPLRTTRSDTTER